MCEVHRDLLGGGDGRLIGIAVAFLLGICGDVEVEIYVLEIYLLGGRQHKLLKLYDGVGLVSGIEVAVTDQRHAGRQRAELDPVDEFGAVGVRLCRGHLEAHHVDRVSGLGRQPSSLGGRRASSADRMSGASRRKAAASVFSPATKVSFGQLR